MSTYGILPASDKTAWRTVLDECGLHDTYHLAEYHDLAEAQGEGEAYLFYYRNMGHCAALPFLLRPVSSVHGLEEFVYNDATSVYGYPGIVSSLRTEEAQSVKFRRGFHESIRQALSEARVIAFFTRLNPLLSTWWLFDGIAHVVPLSHTVAIDLRLNRKEQNMGMSKGHRYDIRKASAVGVTVEEDPLFERIDEFMAIYNTTMDRVGSTAYYYFPRDYYFKLKSFLGDRVKVYFARYQGVIVSCAMFLVTNGIVQYHLSGSLAECPYSGIKLILDHVCEMGTKAGHQWLHLGGGLGSSQDSIFRFKAGFSRLRFPFHIAKSIVDKKAYMQVIDLWHRTLMGKGISIPPDSGYFPEYRRAL
ncbi:MAG: FemAB family protein [Syntrophorhabdus sp. PtaU1.Bin153]|nr:MAG: FemAB family protein [Syntrophorhabdus sp. PtaU1.Bin153]